MFRTHRILTALLAALATVGAAAVPAALAQAPEPETNLVEGAFDATVTTFSVGVQGGLPGYRTASVTGSVRSGAFGAAARVGYGTVGLSAGAQIRLYPPLPIPLAAYVAGGIDVFAGNSALHAALGATVPVQGRFAFDVEGGAARSSTLLGPMWAPYLSVGLSYRVAIDGWTGASGIVRGERRGPMGACDLPPDPDALARGVDAAVRAFVRDAVALYGTSYRDLRYRYSIVGRSVDGQTAWVEIAYEGSAREVLTGNTVTASGTASADMRWTGCAWAASNVVH